MEWRILTPMVLGLAALITLLVAEWRVKQRGLRTAMAGISAVVLAIAVWDFKDLEKQWEQHFLLQAAGGSFLEISIMLENGQPQKAAQILKKWEEEGSLFHLSRAQLHQVHAELSQPSGER